MPGQVTEKFSEDRLSWFQRISWMICAMPELLKTYVWDAFVLFFYAQVVGLNGYLLGIAIAVIIVFDTIVDPFIGTLSDRLTGNRFGRRHVLMFSAILPYMIGIALVFYPPHGASQAATLAWLLATGLLARCGISFWTVPAYALGGELSGADAERRIIAVLRNLGNSIVGLSVPLIAFGLFFLPNSEFAKPQLDPAPYPSYGLFVALLGGALMLIGALGTWKRAKQVEPLSRDGDSVEAELSLGGFFRTFVRATGITPNLGRVFFVAFLVLSVNSLTNQMTLHLTTYFWQIDATWTPRLLWASTAGSIIAMVLAPVVLKFISTKRAMQVGLVTFFGVQAAAIALPLGGLAPAAGTVALAFLVFVLKFLGGLAYGVYVVPFNVLTYDVGDEHEANTGLPAQGLVASFMYLGYQLGAGATALLAGSFLGFIAFPVGVPVDQIPADKVASLALFVLMLLALAGTVMAWLAGTFRMDQQKLERLRSSRNAQRAGA